MRKKQVRRLLLKALNEADPYMLSEELLWDGLYIALAPKPVRSEMDDALLKLEGDHQIIRIKDDDETKVKITAEGKAALLT